MPPATSKARLREKLCQIWAARSEASGGEVNLQSYLTDLLLKRFDEAQIRELDEFTHDSRFKFGLPSIDHVWQMFTWKDGAARSAIRALLVPSSCSRPANTTDTRAQDWFDGPNVRARLHKVSLWSATTPVLCKIWRHGMRKDSLPDPLPRSTIKKSNA